ncbi:MAG: putative transposase [Chloroflexi bacterium]|nr:MAG: putative transposase [Chloroflexota bacterium]
MNNVHNDIHLDPMHYISLPEQRPGAFEHAQPIRQWRKKWPASYEQLLRSLRENKPEGQGVREFISILKLHQSYSSETLEKAVSAAVLNGMMGLDGVMYHLPALFVPLRKDSKLGEPRSNPGVFQIRQNQNRGAAKYDSRRYKRLR